VTLCWTTDYPRSGVVRLSVDPEREAEFALRLRIPAWSAAAAVRVNGGRAAAARPGAYLSLERRWKPGDTIRLELDMSLRAFPGEREAAGRVSLYRGPLLLAWDQRFNPRDADDLPPLELARLSEAKLRAPTAPVPGAPWVLVDLPAENGGTVRLCDFASAGFAGTRYRSWLPATGAPPRSFTASSPVDPK
jgi:DUF1680 family protein